MNRILIFFQLLTLLSPIKLSAQEEQLTGKELLKRSMAFHDPNGQWSGIKMTLIIDQQMPDGVVRPSEVTINNSKGSFDLSYIKNGHLFNWSVDARDSTTSMMDFRVVEDSVLIDSLQLTPERAKRWRDYYTYLYGLPMKLNDPGTQLAELAMPARFNGMDVLVLKVTYDENVGSDTWYFYFHPGTYAMLGYRFYHNEALNDGEYITLDGLEIQQGMRIPKNRTWFTNKENRWLGTDKLISLKLEK